MIAACVAERSYVRGQNPGAPAIQRMGRGRSRRRVSVLLDDGESARTLGMHQKGQRRWGGGCAHVARGATPTVGAYRSVRVIIARLRAERNSGWYGWFGREPMITTCAARRQRHVYGSQSSQFNRRSHTWWCVGCGAWCRRDSVVAACIAWGRTSSDGQQSHSTYVG